MQEDNIFSFLQGKNGTQSAYVKQDMSFATVNTLQLILQLLVSPVLYPLTFLAPLYKTGGLPATVKAAQANTNYLNNRPLLNLFPFNLQQ